MIQADASRASCWTEGEAPTRAVREYIQALDAANPAAEDEPPEAPPGSAPRHIWLVNEKHIEPHIPVRTRPTAMKAPSVARTLPSTRESRRTPALALAPDAWRPLMPAVRAMALAMGKEGLLEIRQGRRTVAPDGSLRGPIRLARTSAEAARGTAREQVDRAKQALGERGPVWWTDGAPDFNRRLAKNTPYRDWFVGLAQ